MLLAHTKSPFSIPTESILLQFLVALFCVWYYDEEDDDVCCILLLMMSIMEECITANEPKSYFIFINLSFLHAFCFAYFITRLRVGFSPSSADDSFSFPRHLLTDPLTLGVFCSIFIPKSLCLLSAGMIISLEWERCQKNWTLECKLTQHSTWISFLNWAFMH